MSVSINNTAPIIRQNNDFNRSNVSANTFTKPAVNNRNYATIPFATSLAYNNISFKGRLEEHKSWGAAVKPNGDVNLKLFTWPDAKKVYAQVASNGLDKNTKFWEDEPTPVKDVNGDIVDLDVKKGKLIELQPKGEGIFEQLADKKEIKDGDKYRFIVVRGNNDIKCIKDPYANKQENILGWSTVYDHNKYQWHDDDWMNNKVPQKISRKFYQNHLTNPYDAKIYEANIATLTKDGNFEAAKKQIDKIARNKKFNTIELMPVENTYSFNWGYDGVDKFAPQDSFLGGPDKLKELIDHAHQQKLNVIMDIVPNHMGPDGDNLGQAGPYEAGSNQFGGRFNYEGKPDESKYVREFISNAAMNWVRNYHCDGIRADMTRFMDSDFTMKQMTSEMHYHEPDAFMIAEDGRDNLDKVTRPLHKNEEEFDNEDAHAKYTENIINQPLSSLNNLGFDSEWDFPYHKQIASAILGNWQEHTKNLFYLDASIRGGSHRVKYPMSHDEIGNNDGTRLINKSVCQRLGMFFKMDGRDDCDKGQKAAQATQNLLTAIMNGKADKMSPKEWNQLQYKNNMKETMPVQVYKDAMDRAISKHKLAVGQTYAAPGPKMIFQGDDNGSLNEFKFFREFSTGKEDLGKGYDTGKGGMEDSKLTSINYSPEMRSTLRGVERFTAKLNDMMDTIPAFSHDGNLTDSLVHPNSDVYALHRKSGKSEIFAVSNYSDMNYLGDYEINFPKGQWREVINSNDSQYAGTGKYLNTKVVQSGSNDKQAISLPANAITIFEKIN